MNVQFIVWMVSVLATWVALKFVFLLFKRLGSRNSIEQVIDGAENKLSEAADKVAGAWKSRKKEKVKVMIR